VPRPLGWVKIGRDNMGWRGYLCVEPVYFDRGDNAESNPTASGWGTQKRNPPKRRATRPCTAFEIQLF